MFAHMMCMYLVTPWYVCVYDVHVFVYLICTRCTFVHMHNIHTYTHVQSSYGGRMTPSLLTKGDMSSQSSPYARHSPFAAHLHAQRQATASPAPSAAGSAGPQMAADRQHWHSHLLRRIDPSPPVVVENVPTATIEEDSAKKCGFFLFFGGLGREIGLMGFASCACMYAYVEVLVRV
jgi:hypothetical protein